MPHSTFGDSLGNLHSPIIGLHFYVAVFALQSGGGGCLSL
jgi:hypothetical protein